MSTTTATRRIRIYAALSAVYLIYSLVRAWIPDDGPVRWAFTAIGLGLVIGVSSYGLIVEMALLMLVAGGATTVAGNIIHDNPRELWTPWVTLLCGIVAAATYLLLMQRLSRRIRAEADRSLSPTAANARLSGEQV